MRLKSAISRDVADVRAALRLFGTGKARKRRGSGGGSWRAGRVFSAAAQVERATRAGASSSTATRSSAAAAKSPILTPAEFRRAADELPRQVEAANLQLLQEALRRARGLSSGRYSSAQLRRLGHPYRHGGHPPMDPSVVNRQSGRFGQSWRLTPDSKGIENIDPKAPLLLGGTSRMIRRPLLDRVYAWLAQEAPKRLAAAAARAFKQ